MSFKERQKMLIWEKQITEFQNNKRRRSQISKQKKNKESNNYYNLPYKE